MKTILLFIALTGFIAVGGYAQDKNCDTKKTASTKVFRKAEIKPRVPVKNQDPTCFMLKKENLGIPGCTDVTYSGDNTYLGNYPQRKTTTYNKTVVTHRTRTTTTVIVPEKQPEPMPAHFYAPVPDKFTAPCYTYRQHNILVKQCPGTFYDNEKRPLNHAEAIEYNTDNTYMGYYPDDETREIKDPKKMENRDAGPIYSPGNDLCFKKCK